MPQLEPQLIQPRQKATWLTFTWSDAPEHEFSCPQPQHGLQGTANGRRQSKLPRTELCFTKQPLPATAPYLISSTLETAGSHCRALYVTHRSDEAGKLQVVRPESQGWFQSQDLKARPSCSSTTLLSGASLCYCDNDLCPLQGTWSTRTQ